MGDKHTKGCATLEVGLLRDKTRNQTEGELPTDSSLGLRSCEVATYGYGALEMGLIQTEIQKRHPGFQRLSRENKECKLSP